MDVPPEIAFRHVEATPGLKILIQEGIDSLEKVYPRLTTCRVMVEEVNNGIPHVRLDIGLPGHDLVVNREVPEDPARRDVASAVRDAFNVARKQLRERRQRVVDGKR